MSSIEVPSVRIREYKQTDFRSICAIDRVCFSEAIAYTPEEMALGLAQRGAFAYVAERETNIIAFVLACQRRRNLGHIITIDILPDFRRSGLGRKLMDVAEQRLAGSGATRIVLEVNVQNEPAIRFYKKLGYIQLRLLPSYYSDGSDAYLMEKVWIPRPDESRLP